MHRRLRGRGIALRGEPRVARGGRGLGVRPRPGARRRDQRARPAADGRRGGAGHGHPGHERRLRAAAVRLRDRRDEGDAHRGRDRRHRPCLRRRCGRLRPERGRQRGGARAARREGDPRHDVPGGKDPRARRRPVGREGRHDVRPVRAEPGHDCGDRTARRCLHARWHAVGRRRRTPAARNGAR